MKRSTIATALAALLLLAGCAAASAEDTATRTAAPTFGPGWRHERMMQARADGQLPAQTVSQRGFGPGMGYGMGYGMGHGRWAGGPPLAPDGSIDTARLPDWCPMKTPPAQK